MILSANTPAANIEIWQPRWKDKTILIAKFKVQTHNKITFTKYPKYDGEYYLSQKTITKYPLETNGKIACYAVPVDELEAFEREPHFYPCEYEFGQFICGEPVLTRGLFCWQHDDPVDSGATD